MKILTFTGRTPSEALKKAKLEIGDEGMLIETREVQKKGLGKPAIYEIVRMVVDAGIGLLWQKVVWGTFTGA